MAPISIGEIHVPGGTGLGAVRCLTLTSPLQSDSGLELFFAMFAAEAPRRVVEKLTERLGEELRMVFFQPGDAETRFEAALKQANKSILAFLYEHGLSMPGIKLRGAAAALSNGKLLVSSRGTMRGWLYVPQSDGLAPYALFDEAPEKNSEPKFFTALQAGTFPDGARFVIATSELFHALDDGYVRDVLGQEDFAKASRDLKTALRAASKPVSILSLSSLLPEQVQEQASARKSGGTRAAKPMLPRPPLISPDVGDVIARGLRIGLLAAGRLLAAAGRVSWSVLKALALLPMRLPKLFMLLSDPERRAKLTADCKTAPDRCLSSAVSRLNALPQQSRMQLFVLVGIGAVFAHAILFSIRHEARAQTIKAYEAQLAELEQLEADFTAGMLYENEDRSRELVSRMETVWNLLPELTEMQKKTKAEAWTAIDGAREKLRRVTPVLQPAVFAALDAAPSEGTSIAWFSGKLYVFSGVTGHVRVFSENGSPASEATVTEVASGVAQAVPARTGFLLQGPGGAFAYWNPETGETSSYDVPDVAGKPALFYQGRLYAAGADGTVTRRTVATKTLGTPSDVLRGAPASPAGIATDGAIYLLYKDGSTRKYLKGASVQDYSPSGIDPAPANASDLWASANSDRIVFIDEGGDRAFAVDRTTGRLLAQYVAPEFKNLRAAAVDEGSRALYLLAASGTIYKVPLK